MKLKMICTTCLLLLGSLLPASPAAGPPGAVLELAADGLVLHLPERAPEKFGSLAELRKAHPALAGRIRLEAAARADRIVPDPEKTRSQPVDIVAGRIPALQLLQFLADYTGFPVVHDSSNEALAKLKILFSADVKGAGYEVVKAHLEAAGMALSQRELPGGRRLVEVAVAAGQARPRPLKESVSESAECSEDSRRRLAARDLLRARLYLFFQWSISSSASRRPWRRPLL